MIHQLKYTLTAVFFSVVSVAAAPPTIEPSTQPSTLAPQLSWKTPDGLAYLVRPDDPILAKSSTSAPATFPATAKPDPVLVQKLVELMDESLTLLAEKSSDKDTQYYENGTWHFTNGSVACQGGPAGMAAMLWKWRQDQLATLDQAAQKRQEWLHKVAVESFERLISDHQQPDGSIKNPGSHQVFIMGEMANTYLLLQDSLDEPTRQRWLAAMKKQVEYMKQTGEIPNPTLPGWKGTDGWYTNGNVEIAEATWLYMVWLATKEQQYKDLFELQWTHTLNPNQLRWKGFGLFYLKDPTRLDGSDGSGFVTEKGGGDPGFDPEYTQLQLSFLGRLYLKSHDPRVLRLCNLLLNAELPHVDPKTMLINATYGSRHSTIMAFANGTTGVTVWCGGRADLKPMLLPQFEKAIRPFYRNNAVQNQGHPGIYRGYGYDLETLLEAAYLAEH